MTARVEEAKLPETQAILNRSRPVDIASRRALYAEEGWNRFDETAEPYTAEQIEAERQRYRMNGL